MNQLTILMPVYNEGKTLQMNIAKLFELLNADGVEFDLILVNDGSRDNSWEIMKKISQDYKNVKAACLSRNFGKEAALFAGLSLVQTERCLVMDSDLQHPPRFIKDMLAKMDETGADIIQGIKIDRGKESIIYKFCSLSFYKFLKLISGLEFNNSSDFKLMDKKVVNTLKKFSEVTPFFRGLVDWSGFNTVDFPFTVDEREGDVSRFGLKGLIKMAISSMLSYTAKPLYITIVAGVLFLISGLVLAVQTLVKYFMGHSATGFTTIILLQLFTGALILICMGIIGAYIARIYNEVKSRPQFIISEVCENDDT